MGPRAVRSNRRGRVTAVVVAALVGGAGAFAVPPSVAAPAGSAPTAATPAAAVAADDEDTADVLVHEVRYRGRTLRLRMQRVTLRGEALTVLVQGEDGALTEQQVPAERAYVGRVVGDRAATASAIVRHDGTVAGGLALDRGVDVRFEGARVVYRGDALPYDRGVRWPASSDDSLNATVAPGGASGTYAFDLGFDLDASYVVDHLGSSVAAAVDEVDEAMVHLVATYGRDARLLPRTGPVVVRTSAARSPYAEARRLGEAGEFYDSHDAALTAAEADWTTTMAGTGWDDVMVLHAFMGGGLANLDGLGGDHPFASSGIVSGSMTSDVNVVRHELGHTLGVGDYHTDAPEDETIMSGNHFARFDGTELRSMWALRDRRLAQGGVLDPVGAVTAPLPPYAALDLADEQLSSVPVSLRPLANDHDANGDTLRLVSVDRSSHLGGTVRRDGDAVTYVPPRVTAARTADWFRYVVQDSSGQRAIGVTVARVSPAPRLGEPGRWRPFGVVDLAPATLRNAASGLLAAAPLSPAGGPPVQRDGTDDGTRWSLTASGDGWRLADGASGRCLTSAPGGRVTRRPCASTEAAEAAVAAQRWRVLRHPYGGAALVSSGGRCLTVGASLDAGTTLSKATCTGSAAERWHLEPQVADGTYRLGNRWAGGVLTAPDERYGPVLVGRRTGPSATWTLENRPGGVVLTEAGTGSCAFARWWEDPAPLVTWHCDDSTQQRLVLAGAPGGGLTVTTSDGRCLGAVARGRGAAVQAGPCTGRSTQRWDLRAP